MRCARRSIRESSPEWDALVDGVQGLAHNDELAAVPVLRFPHWVEETPLAVAELAAAGYDIIQVSLGPFEGLEEYVATQVWPAIQLAMRDVRV